MIEVRSAVLEDRQDFSDLWQLVLVTAMRFVIGFFTIDLSLLSLSA